MKRFLALARKAALVVDTALIQKHPLHRHRAAAVGSVLEPLLSDSAQLSLSQSA